MHPLPTFLTLAFLGLMAPLNSAAQASDTTALFQQLLRADSIVFEEGFNRCRTDLMEKIMHEELEFLHDQSGSSGRAQFFRDFKANICSNPDVKPIRQLVPGSLQVFPLRNQGKLYGALQMGEHQFFLAEPGKPLRYTSSGHFIHTWLLQDGRWQLYRVVSYDHRVEE